MDLWLPIMKMNIDISLPRKNVDCRSKYSKSTIKYVDTVDDSWLL